MAPVSVLVFMSLGIVASSTLMLGLLLQVQVRAGEAPEMKVLALPVAGVSAATAMGTLVFLSLQLYPESHTEVKGSPRRGSRRASPREREWERISPRGGGKGRHEDLLRQRQIQELVGLLSMPMGGASQRPSRRESGVPRSGQLRRRNGGRGTDAPPSPRRSVRGPAAAHIPDSVLEHVFANLPRHTPHSPALSASSSLPSIGDTALTAADRLSTSCPEVSPPSLDATPAASSGNRTEYCPAPSRAPVAPPPAVDSEDNRGQGLHPDGEG